MLTELEIENYRSIRERVHLRDLGLVEVLHGDNSAGKSNVLRAIADAFQIAALARAQGWLNQPTFSGVNGEAFPHLRAHFDLPRAPIEVRVSGEGWSIVLVAKTERGGLELQVTETGSVPPFNLVDEWRTPPKRTAGWDEVLLTAYDRDMDGSQGRSAWLRLEETLRLTLPELGPGGLDRLQWESRTELAWRAPAGRAIPFSLQGSGVRHVKDLLIAMLTGAGAVVAVEEPDAHLSEDAVLRLQRVFRTFAQQTGTQVLLTSHSWAFDTLRTNLRVSRVNGATQVARDVRTAGETDEAIALSERRSHSLERRFALDGSPAAGWVSPGGITQLPPSVRKRFPDPGVLVWAPVDGGWRVIPAHELDDE